MFLRIILFTLLGGLLELGLQQVGGIFIYTAAEVEAVNGTDVKLKCKFSSMKPRVTGVCICKLALQTQKPYPVPDGRFRKPVEWSGDVLEKDASITLKRVTPKFRGTYVCQVRNLPDTRGRDGEVVLRVVNETSNVDPFNLFTALLDLV